MKEGRKLKGKRKDERTLCGQLGRPKRHLDVVVMVMVVVVIVMVVVVVVVVLQVVMMTRVVNVVVKVWW